MRHVFVGLGGNLGNVVAAFQAALGALNAIKSTRVIEVSGVYRTRAWGNLRQPDFLNAVAQIETGLTAERALAELIAIEARLGRVRASEQRWGPRVLDLDLLLYGNAVIDQPALKIPHPRMTERAFVLVPLAELQPSLRLPGGGTVAECLAAVDRSGVRRTEIDLAHFSERSPA